MFESTNPMNRLIYKKYIANFSMHAPTACTSNNTIQIFLKHVLI